MCGTDESRSAEAARLRGFIKHARPFKQLRRVFVELIASPDFPCGDEIRTLVEMEVHSPRKTGSTVNLVHSSHLSMLGPVCPRVVWRTVAGSEGKPYPGTSTLYKAPGLRNVDD
jgi:hypothetical protein